jgi:hypothetical protein
MIIGVILGAIILLLFELNKAYALPQFTLKEFVKKNLLPFIVNLVCSLTILWFKDDIKDIMPITKVYSVIIGMSGQALFKKVVGVFDKNIQTKLGINKNKEEGYGDI